MIFRKPTRSDFVDHCPMAKPIELHDAHVIEYGIEAQWKAYKSRAHQPLTEELWEA